MTDITLTFGKHNGKKLSEVPASYVQWLSEQATICGKTAIPQAAKAYLASLSSQNSSVAVAEKSYSIPTSFIAAEKAAYASEKGNAVVRKMWLSIRDERGFARVTEQDEMFREHEQFYFVRADGSAFLVGDREMMEEFYAEEQRKAYRNAHPDAQWTLGNGKSVRVWRTSSEKVFMVSLDGGAKMRATLEPVPAKDRAFAAKNGVVAVLETNIGNMALTTERMAMIRK